jgi:membrane-bound serine protease (ClpP class)
MTPSHAFLLLILGFLAIYWEFVRPGTVVPGLLGCLLVAAAAYFLWRNAPAPGGLWLIAFAALSFVVEAFWSVPWVAGVLAAIAFTCGVCLLFPSPQRIHPALAIPVSILFSGITLLLTYATKRARRNKRSDIG